MQGKGPEPLWHKDGLLSPPPAPKFVPAYYDTCFQDELRKLGHPTVLRMRTCTIEKFTAVYSPTELVELVGLQASIEGAIRSCAKFISDAAHTKLARLLIEDSHVIVQPLLNEGGSALVYIVACKVWGLVEVVNAETPLESK
jgi:hypothetical protein